jgi:peptidoglycan/xylan/chitin deacetylase (PgdA/CDA1 family)
MTYYIAAYDVEMLDPARYGANVPSCLEACRAIVEVHRRHNMPATFFLVGRVLEAAPDAYRELLDDPLFEVASHTYSHRMLRDQPICGPAASPEEIRQEIVRGKAVVEAVFDRPCLGLRPGCGFVDGLRGAPEVLQLIAEAGYRYVSSAAWGPDYTVPAPLRNPFTYADDGFPQLRELPAHGWHENLLKGHNRIFGMGAARLLLFPPLDPEAIPDGYVTTPEEEFHYNNRVFIDRAVVDGMTHLSLIWHPWSLGMFDPEMRMLEMTFRYVGERGLIPCTFAELDKVLSSAGRP